MKKSSNNPIRATALALTFLLFSFPLHAQTDSGQTMPDNVPALLVKANETYAAKDYLGFRDAMQKLNKKRPNNSEYMYQLVIAYALLDEKRSAYDVMVGMQQQGLAYDFLQSDDSMNIRNTEVFDFLNDMMIIAAKPVGEAEAVFTLPDNISIPEAIAWDESRQKFLIGTVANGSIFAVDMDGQASELLKANEANGMWAVFDIIVDGPGNRLWVTSAASPKFVNNDPADNGRSALFEFDLQTLALIRRYPVPVDGSPHSLGNMVLSSKGDIFIVDRALPIIYKKPAGEQKLKAYLAPREMVSMRGIAKQPGDGLMYVADRELGILIIDTEGGRSGKLVVPKTLNIGGIEGLYLWQDNLVIIQNGIKPQRVMRLQLDEAGTSVTNVRPLAIAQPLFDFPSYGTVRGEDLYYFAHSQWSGSPGKLKPVTVLRTPLNSSADLEQPDMLEYLKQRGNDLEDGPG